MSNDKKIKEAYRKLTQDIDLVDDLKEWREDRHHFTRYGNLNTLDSRSYDLIVRCIERLDK